MCHSDHQDPEKKRRVRCAGLSGLLGVIRKTVNEDLAENIWEPKHMVNNLLLQSLFREEAWHHLKKFALFTKHFLAP